MARIVVVRVIESIIVSELVQHHLNSQRVRGQSVDPVIHPTNRSQSGVVEICPRKIWEIDGDHVIVCQRIVCRSRAARSGHQIITPRGTGRVGRAAAQSIDLAGHGRCRRKARNTIGVILEMRIHRCQ